MEKELFEKLQLIAESYDKTSDLRSYVQNGKGMYLDEQKQEIKFNYIVDKPEAKRLAQDIIAAMHEFGYTTVIVENRKCTQIMYECVLKYKL